MVTDRKRKVTPLGSSAYIEDQELFDKVRKKRRRGLARRLAAFLILVGIAAVSISPVIASQQDVIAQKQQQKVSYQQKLSHMQQKEHTLKNEVKRLKDPDYIGKIARRDYFLTDHGETVFTSSDSDKN